MSTTERVKQLVPSGFRDSAKPLVRRVCTATAGHRPPPDFLVIGTKRGGTTSLWNGLLQHPAVLPLVPSIQNLKSAHFFYWHYDRGFDWYRGFFPLALTRARTARRVGVEPVAGEASPYYMFDPRVPARVQADLPTVKVIMLLRDPVERAYSHYRERVHEGVEPLPLHEALEAEDSRLEGELERMTAQPYYYSRAHDYYSYRSRGIYAPQVRAWQAVIPPERLLILRSEDLYVDPASTFRSVTEFLGLPDHPIEARRYNYHPAAGLPNELRRSLAMEFAPHNQELYQLLGRDLGWTEPSSAS